MADRPILFSGAMVRAILAGQKSQTRRILPSAPTCPPECYGSLPCGVCKIARFAPGDRLWVRETWCEDQHAYDSELNPDGIRWRATDDSGVEGIDDGDGYAVLNADGSIRSCWRPSIHMPRRASRLTLTVTDVRVQRLHEITEADAIAEGVTKVRDSCYVVKGFGYDEAGLCHSSPVTPFAQLWDSINGKRPGCDWESNPWVVAVSFQSAQRNIDARESARDEVTT